MPGAEPEGWADQGDPGVRLCRCSGNVASADTRPILAIAYESRIIRKTIVLGRIVALQGQSTASTANERKEDCQCKYGAGARSFHGSIRLGQSYSDSHK